MEISKSTFISQKNNINNPCVTLNSIHELSSKKKTIEDQPYLRKFSQNNGKNKKKKRIIRKKLAS